VDLSSGDQAALAVPARDTESLGFEPLPTGAAQLWADGAVTLYDRNGAILQTLDAHQAPVRDIAVSPDGTWAVTVGDGALIVLWDVDPASGRWVQRELLTGHRGDVITADVDPTGSQLFTTSLDDMVITWDMTSDAGFGAGYPRIGDRSIANGPEEITPGGLMVVPTRAAGGAGIDPDDPSDDTTSVAATFFDARTGDLVEEVVLGETLAGDGSGSSVELSPDRTMVAVTWGLGATVLDTRTREVISRFMIAAEGHTPPDGRPVPTGPIWSAAWSRDGTQLLLGMGGTPEGHNGEVAVVDARTGQLEDVVGYSPVPQVVEPTPDGQYLAVAGRAGGEIHVLDADSLAPVDVVELGSSDPVVALAFSPDGRLLIAGGRSGSLYLIDTDSWEPTRGPTTVHEESVLQVAWLDNRTVVSSGIDATVRLFDAERGLVRARPLRAVTDPGTAETWFVPAFEGGIVALSGDRPGRRYPLDPEVWLDEACAVVGRDLTRAEWDRYLPGRDYEPTCSDRP
jgi:WD40 repeat protein